jgi:hypothetical protein
MLPQMKFQMMAIMGELASVTGVAMYILIVTSTAEMYVKSNFIVNGMEVM